jgi:hypothetical protein
MDLIVVGYGDYESSSFSPEVVSGEMEEGKDICDEKKTISRKILSRGSNGDLNRGRRSARSGIWPTSSAHLRACFAEETEPDPIMEPGSVSTSASRRRQRDQY